MPLIRIEELDFHYDSPFTAVFEKLSLVVDTSWRTALVGRNGRGKTTLLRLVAGELEPLRGKLEAPPGMCLFPYRIEYRRTAGEDGSQSHPLVTMQFFEVAYDLPIPANRFQYNPGNAKYEDRTEDFLGKLGVKE